MKRKIVRKPALVGTMAVVTGAALTGSCGVANATEFIWNGTTNSNFQTATNWSTAPTANVATNAGVIYENASANPLTYTSAEGTTTFTQNGGDVNWIGHSSGTATFNMTGGTLNLACTFTGDAGVNPSMWIGNAPGQTGAVNLSGGTINLTNGLLLARQSSTNDTLTITGTGVFNVGGTGSAGGTTFGLAAGQTAGVGIITLGGGTPLFAETATNSLTFNSAGSYVNFLSGSQGQLSLNQVTSSTTFDSLVTAGRIRVDGATASPSQFQFTTTGTGTTEQGIYSLAVPEPSSLGLLGLGAAALLRRRRRC